MARRRRADVRISTLLSRLLPSNVFTNTVRHEEKENQITDTHTHTLQRFKLMWCSRLLLLDDSLRLSKVDDRGLLLRCRAALCCRCEIVLDANRPDQAEPPGLHLCEQILRLNLHHLSLSLCICSKVSLSPSFSMILSKPAHPVFHPIFPYLLIFSPSVLSPSADFSIHIVRHLSFFPLHLFERQVFLAIWQRRECERREKMERIKWGGVWRGGGVDPRKKN